MATVSINTTDLGVARLAELSGWSSYEALGRVATLRARCAEMGTDTPGDAVLDIVLDGRVGLLVRSHLGVLTADGGVRVLDVDLPARRGRAGGVASSSSAARARGRFVTRGTGTGDLPATPAVDDRRVTGESPASGRLPVVVDASPVVKTGILPPAGPRASDLSLGSGPVSESPLPDGSPLPPEPQTPARPQALPLAAAGAVTALSPAQRVVQLLTNDAWEIAQREHARLRPLIDPEAQPWTALAAGAGKTDMLARIGELLEIESAGGEAVRDAIRRRVAVATAEAERDRSLKWFTPTKIWGDQQFWRAVEVTPEQVAQRGALARLRFTEFERERAIGVLAKLSLQSGVTYTGLDEHLQLIVGHLRRGVDHMDLRAIVAYCATERAWKDDPKMRNHLTPETLFGEGKIAKYLEPARAWYAKLPQDEPPLEPRVELDDQGDEQPEADA